ncbi:MAG: hypothetical protein ACP5HU_09850 [Phycisphaerae bacterium]
MEVRRPSAARTISFAILFASLIIAAGMLVALLVTMLDRAEATDDPELRRILVRVAWATLVMLAVDMLVLLWGAMRFMSRVLGAPPPRRPPTPYIDAWAEAGRRLKLEEQDEDDEEDRRES